MSVLVNKPSQLSAATGTAVVSVDLILLESKVNTLTVHPRWKNKANWKSVEFIYENAAKQRYKIVFKIDQNKLTFTINFPANTRDGMFSCVDLNIAGYNSDFLEIDRSQFLSLFGSTGIFDINVIEGYGYVAPPDNTPPFITSIIPPDNRNYITGETMLFTVVFSKPVYQWSASALNISRLGESTTYFTATYLSGNGTNTLVYRYIVSNTLSLHAPNGIEIRSPMTGSLRDVPIFTPNSTAAILTFANIQLPLVTVNSYDTTVQRFSLYDYQELISPNIPQSGEQMSFNMASTYSQNAGVEGIYASSVNFWYDDIIDQSPTTVEHPRNLYRHLKVFDKFILPDESISPAGPPITLSEFSSIDEVNPLIDLNNTYKNANSTYLQSPGSVKIAGEIVTGSIKYVIEQRHTSTSYSSLASATPDGHTLTIRVHEIPSSSYTINQTTILREIFIDKICIRTDTSVSGTFGSRAVRKAGVVHIAHNHTPAFSNNDPLQSRNQSCILLLAGSKHPGLLEYGDQFCGMLYTENFKDWVFIRLMDQSPGSDEIVSPRHKESLEVCDYIDNWQSARMIAVANGRYYYLKNVRNTSENVNYAILSSIGGLTWHYRYAYDYNQSLNFQQLLNNTTNGNPASTHANYTIQPISYETTGINAFPQLYDDVPYRTIPWHLGLKYVEVNPSVPSSNYIEWKVTTRVGIAATPLTRSKKSSRII